MNQRIRELAEQAGYNIKELDVQEQMVAEKFAELIIEECISACATDRLSKTAGAEDLIREHFRVEL